eukprot:TRINITY_DN50325_c0_g1_i1.p1 TRINITY_DN50325_c0_g1~~TRINITY_DN50325_c0_g1_i1.p1  ORF type:complete len:555 (-),score=34.84 TRINITY_DN50325_c0_g1_i1:22-1686(-)
MRVFDVNLEKFLSVKKGMDAATMFGRMMMIEKAADSLNKLKDSVAGASMEVIEKTRSSLDSIAHIISEAIHWIQKKLSEMWHGVVALFSLQHQIYESFIDNALNVDVKGRLCEIIWNAYPQTVVLVDMLSAVWSAFRKLGRGGKGKGSKGFAISIEISAEAAAGVFAHDVSAVSFGLGVNFDMNGNVNRFCFVAGSNGLSFSLPPKIGADAGVGVSIGIWPNGMAGIFTGQSVSYCMSVSYEGVEIPGCLVQGDQPEFPNFKCREEDCPVLPDVYGIIIPFSYTHGGKIRDFAEEGFKKVIGSTSATFALLYNTAPPSGCVWACGDREHCGQSFQGTCDDEVGEGKDPKEIEGPFKQYNGLVAFDVDASADRKKAEDVPMSQACGRKPRPCTAPNSKREFLCQFWLPCLEVDMYGGFEHEGSSYHSYPTRGCISSGETRYPCRYCHPSGIDPEEASGDLSSYKNLPKCETDPEQLYFFLPLPTEFYSEKKKYFDLSLRVETQKQIIDVPNLWKTLVNFWYTTVHTGKYGRRDLTVFMEKLKDEVDVVLEQAKAA